MNPPAAWRFKRKFRVRRPGYYKDESPESAANRSIGLQPVWTIMTILLVLVFLFGYIIPEWKENKRGSERWAEWPSPTVSPK